MNPLFRNSGLCIILVAGSLTLPGCSHPSKSVSDRPDNGKYGDTKAPHPPRTAEARTTALTHDTALARAKQVGRVSYNLWFGMDDTHDFFEGRATINFELKSKARDISDTIPIDFMAGTLRSLAINRAPVDLSPESGKLAKRYDGTRIYLKASELLVGNNRIEISYVHPFNPNGDGLHRFKDPEDGNVYLYTDLEPVNARQVFPCFDQPDLKATFELTVETPEEWEVIANTPEREVNTVDGRNSWAFPPSPVFSTYLFALHAGPYKSWKSDANGIPLRLFARRSLARYVDFEEWLDVTKKGLEFYNLKFGYPYPYAKYDQVIVPDFNSGAMENVAAVTFSEAYIYRSKATKDVRRSRADTILHEMAHMWFGDLVTMKWWNGLWLNESFASFMAAWATEDATSFEGAWQNFFKSMKLWAYWEDQLATTHPIEVSVPDTDTARSNFDGITYGKGGAVLKQLAFYLGNDDFLEGIQRYFQKYALRNTTIFDFFKTLAEASGQPLAKWERSWLLTPGVNTVRAEWACADSKIASFKLIQAAPELPPNTAGRNELRPHKTQVGFYRHDKNGRLRLAEFLPVNYSLAETPVPAAVGKPCPALVDPNHGDFDYVKSELDSGSLQAASQHLGQIEDPFARQMLWSTLWNMVIDGKLRAQDYADTVMSQSVHESSTQILSRLLQTLVQPHADEPSVLKFLGGELRAQYWKKIEDYCQRGLLRAAPGGDPQIIWFQAFSGMAISPKGVAWMKSLLGGQAKLSGFKMDQERRWTLIQGLARNGAPGMTELIAQELKKDPTDHGEKSAIAADSLIPDAANKAKWLARILKPLSHESAPPQVASNSPAAKTGTAPQPSGTPLLASPAPSGEEAPLPFPKLRFAMTDYGMLGQEDAIRASLDSYFQSLPKLAKFEDEEYATAFAESLFPSLCDTEVLNRADAALKAGAALPPDILRSLKILRQEEERCIAARKKSETPAS